MLFVACITSIIHALIPAFFKRTSAQVIIKLYQERLVNHTNPSYRDWIKNDVSRRSKLDKNQ